MMIEFEFISMSFVSFCHRDFASSIFMNRLQRIFNDKTDVIRMSFVSLATDKQKQRGIK